MTLEEWRLLIDTSLTGSFLCAKHGARAMIEAGNGGSIINLGSMYSVFGPPRAVGYASAKAGILGLSRALAVELAPHGIRSNAILPGWIETAMTKPPLGGEIGYEVRRKTPAGPLRPPGRPGRRRALPGLGRLGVRDRHRAAGRRRLSRGRAPARRPARQSRTGAFARGDMNALDRAHHDPPRAAALARLAAARHRRGHHRPRRDLPAPRRRRGLPARGRGSAAARRGAARHRAPRAPALRLVHGVGRQRRGDEGQLRGRRRALGHPRPVASASRSTGCSAGSAASSIRTYNTCAGPWYGAGARRRADPQLEPAGGRGRPQRLRGPRRVPAPRRRARREPALGGPHGDEDLAVRQRRLAHDGLSISAQEMREALEPIEKVRAAVGDRMDIMVELHALWKPGPGQGDRPRARGLRALLGRGRGQARRHARRLALRRQHAAALHVRRDDRDARALLRAARALRHRLPDARPRLVRRSLGGEEGGGAGRAARRADRAPRLHRADRPDRGDASRHQHAERGAAGVRAGLLQWLVPRSRHRAAGRRRRDDLAARRPGARHGAAAGRARARRAPACGGLGSKTCEYGGHVS